MKLSRRLTILERAMRIRSLKAQEMWLNSLTDEQLEALVESGNAKTTALLMSASTTQLEHLVKETDRLFLAGVSQHLITRRFHEIMYSWVEDSR